MLKILVPLRSGRVRFKMYQIKPVLTDYAIKDAGLMYKIKPIQTIGEATSTGTMEGIEAEQDKLFDQLNALSQRVGTVLNVLSKSSSSAKPLTTHGIKFVEKRAPLDIVMNINPEQSLPKGTRFIIHFDIQISKNQ